MNASPRIVGAIAGTVVAGGLGLALAKRTSGDSAASMDGMSMDQRREGASGNMKLLAAASVVGPLGLYAASELVTSPLLSKGLSGASMGAMVGLMGVMFLGMNNMKMGGAPPPTRRHDQSTGAMNQRSEMASMAGSSPSASAPAAQASESMLMSSMPPSGGGPSTLRATTSDMSGGMESMITPQRPLALMHGRDEVAADLRGPIDSAAAGSDPRSQFMARAVAQAYACGGASSAQPSSSIEASAYRSSVAISVSQGGSVDAMSM